VNIGGSGRTAKRSHFKEDGSPLSRG
jgi:hypothetical protein